jgi:hypothetical protein
MKILRYWDKIAMLVSCALLAGGFALAMNWRHEIGSLPPVRFKLAVGPATNLSAEDLRAGRQVARREWNPPVAQSRGPGWVYDVFTPPAIVRDSTSGRLALDLPEGGAPAELELIAVKREPYRLQLTGYFGGPGNYTVVFAREKSPGVVLARGGFCFEPSGLILQSFANKGMSGEPDAPAEAVLLDWGTGERVVLVCGRRKLTDVPFAVVQAGSAGGPPVELREGDSFHSAGSDYRVEHITLEPAEVSLTTISPDPAQIKRCVLHVAHEPTDDGPSENESPTATLATVENDDRDN